MSEARALYAGPGARRALVDGARGQVELVLRGGGGYMRLGSSDWLLLPGPTRPSVRCRSPSTGSKRLICIRGRRRR